MSEQADSTHPQNNVENVTRFNRAKQEVQPRELQREWRVWA